MGRYKIGQRVRITEDCREQKTATGKMGHYAGDADGWMPILKLDDGDVIYGCECWWEPIENEDSMPPLEEAQQGLLETKLFYRHIFRELLETKDEEED